MASYTYKSWQTINLNLRGEDEDKVVEIFDSPYTSSVIFRGIVLAGHNLQNLNDILAPYVNPTTISFNSSLQENSNASKKFYIRYRGTDGGTFYTDDVTIIYDWSYKTDLRTRLSDPISNLVDVRQYLLYTVRPQTVPTNLVVKIGNVVQDTFELTQNINYNYVKYLSDDLVFPGEFNFDYSYDYFVTNNSLVPGTFAEFTIGSYMFIIAHTCYRYCIYYFNQYGGWDSILFAGKTIQNDNLSRLSYKKNYVATSLDFNKVNYLTTIQENWQLNTSFLDDLNSQKMINMMASNCLYLHDLEENKIIPINITNSKCEHKTYKNQGRKLYTYTIDVSSSQPKYRI